MDTKEIFAQRVIELRKEKGINQAQLAERVGVSKTSANLYESATRVPDIQVLARYAKELEVTSDYLIGLSDNRTAETAAIGDKLGLSDNAIIVLKETKRVLKELEKGTKEKPGSVPEDEAERYFYLKTRLWVINWLVERVQFITVIQQYLFEWDNYVIASIDYEKLNKLLPSSPKSEIIKEIKAANDSLNLRNVEKNLSELREEYKQKILPLITKSKEDTDAEENKREE